MKGKTLDPVKYQETFVGCCDVCQKAVVAYYARYHLGGVCSKKCMVVKDKDKTYYSFALGVKNAL